MTFLQPSSLRLLALLACATACSAAAQSTGVVGFWKEPGGSVLHVAPCGNQVCATLARISPTAPKTTDSENPDASLRGRPLCGVVIGTGFHLEGNDKADDGKLYDPKSGKTYHGTLRSEGNTLHLRGYIGFKMFGRSEDWTRTSPVADCPRS